MNHCIYNLYPAITLRSEMVIYLQIISLSHTYEGLVCGSPNEKINDNIISEIKEEFETDCFIIKPTVTMLSEDDFFGRDTLYDKHKTIPLFPPIKVEALFECYEGDECTFLHLVWFQDDFLIQAPTKEISNINWTKYAGQFEL